MIFFIFFVYFIHFLCFSGQKPRPVDYEMLSILLRKVESMDQTMGQILVVFKDFVKIVAPRLSEACQHQNLDRNVERQHQQDPCPRETQQQDQGYFQSQSHSQVHGQQQAPVEQHAHEERIGHQESRGKSREDSHRQQQGHFDDRGQQRGRSHAHEQYREQEEQNDVDEPEAEAEVNRNVQEESEMQPETSRKFCFLVFSCIGRLEKFLPL